MLHTLILGLLAACATPPPAPSEDDALPTPNIPDLLVALASPLPRAETLRAQLGGSWTQTDSEYFTDHQSTDATGFRRAQIREPGPRARAGAIIGLELDSEPCVSDAVIREALGPGAPSPARPGEPAGLRHEVVRRGDVSIYLGYNDATGCLVQASVRHPAPPRE